MAACQVVLFLLVTGGFIYFGLKARWWTLGTTSALIALGWFGSVSFFTLALLWVLFLPPILFIYLKKIRQRLVTYPLIRLLRQKMPPISDTEREAIEAGDVWFEQELLSGRPHWKKLLHLNLPQLTAEEQAFLDNQVETLCLMTSDWKIINEYQDLPVEIWDYLKQECFFGLVIPKEYGGLGFSALAHSSIILKIATRSLSTAIDTMVPNSLGPAELLLHYGTDEQKKYYLPRLAQGLEIPCFALTSPDGGSDAGSMKDSGVVCYGEHEGKKVLGIRVSWDKRYITLAPIATVLGLAFRLYDPDNLLGSIEDCGICLCLIPTSHPGVEIGHRHYPLRLAFLNGPTRGKNVFIPMDWIIGGMVRVGQGWKMLMECLSIGRGISLPAVGSACAQLSYRMTGAYARLRQQFNVPISQFEGVEEALSVIAGSAYLLEATRLLTAGAVDLKIKPSILSAIAKYHMTEIARKLINHAMDIHGGHAIQAGPRNFLEMAYTAMPIGITVEGANILTRNLIIFGQGIIRCHPYLLKEVTLLSAEETSENNTALDQLLLSHIGHVVSNTVRTLWLGLTNARFVWSPEKGASARYYRALTRMSSAFAFLSDVCLLIFSGNLKRKERISARLGDILSQLYLASAVLKYFKDRGSRASDIDSVHWCVQTCLADMQIAFNELLQNLPIPGLGRLLRWFIFPFGAAYPKPTDRLSHRMTQSMLHPNELRDALTRFCYISKDETDPMRSIENAFEQVEKIDPLWKKFKSALRKGTISLPGTLDEQLDRAVQLSILTLSEMQDLKQFFVLYQDIIRVNEFSFDLQTVIQ